VWLSYFDLTRTNWKRNGSHMPQSTFLVILTQSDRKGNSSLQDFRQAGPTRRQADPLTLTKVLPRTCSRPCPRSYLFISLPIPLQLWCPHSANSSSTRQSGTIRCCISYRWSERAAIRNAPSNLCLMDRDVDSGILPRSPLTDNTLKYVASRRLSTYL
jgi:hypothetical protein